VTQNVTKPSNLLNIISYFHFHSISLYTVLCSVVLFVVRCSLGATSKQSSNYQLIIPKNNCQLIVMNFFPIINCIVLCEIQCLSIFSDHFTIHESMNTNFPSHPVRLISATATAALVEIGCA
jgi:hypothetical protein